MLLNLKYAFQFKSDWNNVIVDVSITIDFNVDVDVDVDNKMQ
jgi:hypothetical protein